MSMNVHDSGTWVWMTMMMLVFWSLLVFGALALFRSARPPANAGVGDAQRLLDERYARGEIDEGDYTRRRAQLRAGH